MNEQQRTIKKEFNEIVLKTLNEYIDEAEHQDGAAYWDEFKNGKQAAKDFGRYLQVTVLE